MPTARAPRTTKTPAKLVDANRVALEETLGGAAVAPVAVERVTVWCVEAADADPEAEAEPEAEADADPEVVVELEVDVEEPVDEEDVVEEEVEELVVAVTVESMVN
jgi:hypothetical protein